MPLECAAECADASVACTSLALSDSQPVGGPAAGRFGPGRVTGQEASGRSARLALRLLVPVHFDQLKGVGRTDADESEATGVKLTLLERVWIVRGPPDHHLLPPAHC